MENEENNIKIDVFGEEYTFRINERNEINTQIYNRYLELVNKYDNITNINERIEYCNVVCKGLDEYIEKYLKDRTIRRYIFRYMGDNSKCVYFEHKLEHNDMMIILHVTLIYKICKDILENGRLNGIILVKIKEYIELLNYISTYMNLCMIHLTFLDFVNNTNIENLENIKEFKKQYCINSNNTRNTRFRKDCRHIYAQLYIELINRFIKKLGRLTVSIIRLIFIYDCYEYLFYNELNTTDLLKIIENTVINRYIIDKDVFEELIRIDCEIILLFIKYALLTPEYYINSCKTLLSLNRPIKRYLRLEAEDRGIALNVIPIIIMLLERKYYPNNIYEYIDKRLIRFCNKSLLTKFVDSLLSTNQNMTGEFVRTLYKNIDNIKLCQESEKILFGYIVKELNSLNTSHRIEIIRQKKIDLNHDVIIKLIRIRSNYIIVKFLIEEMNIELTIGDIMEACFHGNSLTIKYLYNKYKDNNTIMCIKKT